MYITRTITPPCSFVKEKEECREKRTMLPIQLYIVKSPMKKYLYFPLFEGDFYFIKKYIYFSSLKFVDFWIFNFWTIDFAAEKPYLHTLIFITL